MPTLAEMRAQGMEPEDFEAEDDVEVWPENWPAWVLFIECSTQWRIGMNGPTGLDYSILFARMTQLGLTPAEWEQHFADVRTLEGAALEQIRTND